MAQKGIKYFNGPKETEKEIENILNKLESNKKFINDVTGYIENTKGINNSVADKIVKSDHIQSLIKKIDNDNVDKVELESSLKTIFLKAWTNDSNKAIEKVKNDIK